MKREVEKMGKEYVERQDVETALDDKDVEDVTGGSVHPSNPPRHRLVDGIVYIDGRDE